MLDNTLNQPSKFRTKHWVEKNDGSFGTYNTDSQIKSETSMIGAIDCSVGDYSVGYILVKGTIIVTNTGTIAAPNNRDKKVIFKNCAPYDDCISDINNKEIDHAKEIDVVMTTHNLIEYSDNYMKTIIHSSDQVNKILISQLINGISRVIFFHYLLFDLLFFCLYLNKALSGPSEKSTILPSGFMIIL